MDDASDQFAVERGRDHDAKIPISIKISGEKYIRMPEGEDKRFPGFLEVFHMFGAMDGAAESEAEESEEEGDESWDPPEEEALFSGPGFSVQDFSPQIVATN